MPQSSMATPGLRIPEHLYEHIVYEPDATGLSDELVDHLAAVDKMVGLAVFWLIALRLKRGEVVTLESLAKGTKTPEPRIFKCLQRLTEAGLLEVADEAALRRSRSYSGRWMQKNRHRYPTNWKQIASGVKDRAGWKCEACGNPHGRPPYVLTVDHCVDHNPANCADWNLVALCQRCHLRRHGMKPKPLTKVEAIERLRARYEAEQSQMNLLGNAGSE